MTSNTLFVTAFIDLKEDRSNEKSVPVRLNHFQHIASSGIPILLFLSKSYEEEYRNTCSFPNVRIVFLEFEELETYNCVPENINLPPNRNVHKDTRNFLILMNAKSEYIKRAIDIAPDFTHYSWIDFSICHVFKNMNQSLAYLSMLGKSKLKDTLLVFPGCHEITEHPSLYTGVFWRFCGGFFIGDKQSLINWSTFFKETFANLTQKFGLLWEVNIWAIQENLHHNSFKPTWFKADHNDSIIQIPGSCLSVVACLTTNLNQNCLKTIASIQDQVEHIYVASDISVASDINIHDLGSKVTVLTTSNPYSISLSPQIGNEWIFFCEDYEYKEGLIQSMLNSVKDLSVYQNSYDTVRAKTSGGLIHNSAGNLIHRSFLNGLEFSNNLTLSISCYLQGIRVKPTGIESHTDIYKTLLEQIPINTTTIPYTGIRFTGDYDGVMMYLTDVSGAKAGSHGFPWLEGYTPSSSSFCSFEGRNYLNVRYVNYQQTPEGRYIIWDPKSALRTQNLLMELDASLEQIRNCSMKIDSDKPIISTEIYGLEDVRLYVDEGRLRFIATQKQWTPVSRMVIGDCSGNTYQNITVLEPPSWTGCEKNWIPLSSNRFIYQWHPMRIGVPENGVLRIVQEWPTPATFEGIRGSTIFHPFGPNELIGVVHSSVEGSPRHYYHRLVVLDSATFRPLRYTAPFVFGRIGIEFCIGLALEGEKIRFWYSQHDRDPIWVSVPLNTFTFLPISFV